MSDLIDNDFEALPLTWTMDEAFPLGQVLIAARTAEAVHPAFVQECLARHAAGDWGEVDRDLRWANAHTRRGGHGMPIVSKYPVGGGRLQIVTKADGSVTSIILYDADPASSPPEAAPPARFEDYEIHGLVEFSDGKVRVPDEDAETWGLFGRFPGGDLQLIGDFATPGGAEQVYARITGRNFRSRP